jgi:activator of HSP90 ATPase
MTPVIRHSVRFSCPPDVLFELYMDSARHSVATGARAKVGRRAGDQFTAFEGALSGRNLMVIPKRMIVQAWRSTNFKKTDPDSVLVLEISKVAGGARIDLVHVGVPAQSHEQRVFRVTLAVLGQVEDAEDAMQETFQSLSSSQTST